VYKTPYFSARKSKLCAPEMTSKNFLVSKDIKTSFLEKKKGLQYLPNINDSKRGGKLQYLCTKYVNKAQTEQLHWT
jgi:hypothetical protein